MQGKLSSSDLKRLIIDKINIKNDDIVVEAGLGKDCALVDVGSELLVFTMDPITASKEDLGKLLVRINVNDIATSGARPLYMLATLLMPTTSDASDIEVIMNDVTRELDRFGIDLIGGHTEFTGAVNTPIGVAVLMAKKPKVHVNDLSNICQGDYIVMTNTAGIEGTGIIASECSEEVEKIFGKPFLEASKAYIDKTVILEECLLASEIGVKAIHDVTEGGLLGAVWEMIYGANLGCMLYEDKIRVSKETKALSDYYNIDPLRLIGSGSMIAVVAPDKIDELLSVFDSKDVDSTIIGRVTSSGLYIEKAGVNEVITEPESDELYKVL